MTITITAPTNDSNRTDDEIMLRALEAGTVTNRADPVSITVEDLHKLPTVTAKITNMDGDEVTSVAEGEEVTLEFEADKAATETITITLSRASSSEAGADDYELSAMTATIASGATMSGKLTLTAEDNADVMDEMLVLTGAVTGVAANGAAVGTPVTVTLTIEDKTEKRIRVLDGAMDAIYDAMNTAKGSDGKLNPDDDFSVPNSMLFDTMTGYNASVKATSSTNAASTDDSGDAVKVMPDSAGTAMITITGTAVPAAATFQASQLSTDSAQIMFEVMVEAAATTVPDAPAAPTLTARANTDDLDVTWEPPANDGGSAIIDYDVRYRQVGTTDWIVRTDLTQTSTRLEGLGHATTWEAQVMASNANGVSPWSATSEPGTTSSEPVLPDLKGQITKIEVTDEKGNPWDDRGELTIGGIPRVHVDEGEINAFLSVTVQWDHAELTALHAAGDKTARIWLELQGARVIEQIYALPDWLSWIDDEGDVDFPNTTSRLGELGAWFTMTLPAAPKPDDFPNSIRHHKHKTEQIRLLIHHDEHEAENDAFYVEATYSDDVDLAASDARNLSTPLIVIEDDDPQEVVITRKTPKKPTPIYESDGSAVFTITAKPKRQDLPLGVRLDMVELGGTTVSSAKISLSTAALTLNAAKDGVSNSSDLTVHLPASDGNRVDDKYELHASVNLYSLASGAFNEIFTAKEPITVIDVHKLPWLTVSPASETVKEGGEIELKLTINRNPHNTIATGPETRQYTSEPIDVMVDMLPEGIEVMPRPVKFPEHNKKAPWMQEMMVKVTAKPNNNLDGARMATLTFEAAGTIAANGMDSGDGDDHIAVATLTVEDGTERLVWPKTDQEIQNHVYAQKEAGMGADMMFNPGEMIEITPSALFNAATGVTVSYTAKSDHDHVATTTVSGGMVTVTAGDEVGMAHITITAHASMPSTAKGLPQTDPREASVIFPVEVGLAALTIEISGPADMNIVEGDMDHPNGTMASAMVTAEANRDVTEDVTVTLMRDRAMSSASDDDFMADPIVIKAGTKTGSTMVMAEDDGMMENMDNMPEELVLYGMAEGMAGEVTGTVTLYIWDYPVPALPVIAQLLLAAFLAIGGYRRYRRR